MGHVHAMEYYAASKRNEVPIYATMWMNFEHIILSEKAGHKKPHIV